MSDNFRAVLTEIGKWFGTANAPAWVQAVGSVVAILAAGWIAVWTVKRQHHLERTRTEENRRRERKGIYEAVYQLGDAVYAVLAKADVLSRDEVEMNPLHLEGVQIELESIARVIDRTDPLALQNITLLDSLHVAHNVAATAAAHFRSLRTDLNSSVARVQASRDVQNICKESMFQVKDRMDAVRSLIEAGEF